MPAAGNRKTQQSLARYSPLAFAFFASVFERTLRNGIHTVRVANAPSPTLLQTPHLVIYSNHPSWWDGIIFMFLARRLLAGRRAFTPVDAAMVDRYAFLEKVGGFRVEQGRLRGARDFRAMCQAILAVPTNVLIMAAQDRFADPRERPIRLAGGLPHLRDLAADVVFLPLAIEYVFGEERRPDAFLRFGEPISAAHTTGGRAELMRSLEGSLTETMDHLMRDIVLRDETAFAPVFSGSKRIDIVYDAWRRVKSLVRGETFDAGHGSRP